MKNLEFKAELRDTNLAIAICKKLGGLDVGTFSLNDTYYRVADSLFKKRETKGEATEYIFYERERTVRPAVSSFRVYTEAEAQARFGATPLPVWIAFQKSRHVFFLDGVSVNIDTIDGLGVFIELEVMVPKGTDINLCCDQLEDIREKLSVCMGEPLAVSYAELMSTEDEFAQTNEGAPPSTS